MEWGEATGQGLSSLNSDHFDQTHCHLDQDANDGGDGDDDIRRIAEIMTCHKIILEGFSHTHILEQLLCHGVSYRSRLRKNPVFAQALFGRPPCFHCKHCLCSGFPR